jgi:hypothetical protein
VGETVLTHDAVTVESMDEERATDYVSNSAWLASSSRPDTIDEIADQFERVERGDEAFWTRVLTERAARDQRIAPGYLEQRAAS